MIFLAKSLYGQRVAFPAACHVWWHRKIYSVDFRGSPHLFFGWLKVHTYFFPIIPGSALPCRGGILEKTTLSLRNQWPAGKCLRYRGKEVLKPFFGASTSEKGGWDATEIAWMNPCTNAWLNQWSDKSMNQWMGASVSRWINESRNLFANATFTLW